MVAAVAERVAENVVREKRTSASVRAVSERIVDDAFLETLADIVPFPHIPASAPPIPRARPRIAFVGADDARTAARKEVALKCWLIGEEESARGYALDVSKDGARLSGVGSGFSVGQRLLCKLLLDTKEPALVVRCKVMRASSGEVGIRFLELGFDEWFRLGRFLDRL